MIVPNKVTLIASAIYAITPPAEEKKVPVLWTALSDEAKLPFNKAAEFLCQYTSGAALTEVDRAKLAASVEKAASGIEANANDIVAIFLNVSAVLG